MALAVGTLVLTGALTLIDAGSELARDQAQLASLQQSLRVAQSHMVRAVRTAGRGPLPQALLATGPDLHDALAVAVRSNVGDGERIAADPASPLILAGTDVLTRRGVLTGPLYQLAPDALTLDDPDDPTTGSLTIEATTPSGVPHDLTPLRDMIDGWAQSG